MIRYKVIFVDGGVLNHRGNVKIENDVFILYTSNNFVKYYIPVSKVKYIEMIEGV